MLLHVQAQPCLGHHGLLFNYHTETQRHTENIYLTGGCPGQRLPSDSVSKHQNYCQTCVKTQTCKSKTVTCIYQSVQGVVDLMDACQCSQMRIQLKIWMTNQKKKNHTQVVQLRFKVFVIKTSIYSTRTRSGLVGHKGGCQQLRFWSDFWSDA